MRKIVKWTLFIPCVVGLFIKGVSAADEKTAVEGRYHVKVKHNYSECEKSEGHTTFIQGVIKKINDIVEKDKTTYQNQAYITKMEHDYIEGMDQSPYIQFDICYKNDNKTTLLTYLTPDLMKKDFVEDIYNIFVKNPYGDKCEEKDGYKSYINKVIREIHDLIVNNKSTYKDTFKLTELEQDSEVNIEEGKSPYVRGVTCMDTDLMLSSYLSPELVPKIEALDNVILCEVEVKNTIPEPGEPEKDGAEFRTKSFMMTIVMAFLSILLFIY
ncbi:hypothetical protein BCR32DRAFT_296990 [Anaeromyces robustus]|uniref:Uncharacterized protein n=1 Tax=Anaeromyces robustus TaxID=1754192 RepID=A0A1Y1WPQ4_9FUNG|nr:hypothetical protein BCR32DRAFT_296990 [Anaeromyces robustus]|eukprot:ORX75278.1 hypothetical protein BCR32DRAFT_296990 [Anaeromyces robustus]